MNSEGISVHPPLDQQGDAVKPEAAALDEKPVTEELAAPQFTIPDDWEPLPLDPNYKNPGYRMYSYRGMILNSFHVPFGFLPAMEAYRARPSDVIVTSFPRSGTSWLQEITWRVTHRDGRGAGVPLEDRFPLLDSLPQEGILPPEKMTDQRFFKTHLHYRLLPESVKTTGAKVLYISRDVRDVCVSFYHFCRAYSIYEYRGTFAEFRDSFMRGAVLYGPYREHLKGYLEHLDTVLCLTYEQLHQDRASVVRRVADFLGVSLTDADVDDIVRNTSFDVMQVNPDTNFKLWEKTGMSSNPEEGSYMRKGVSGDWKNYFTEEESEAFIKWSKEEVA